MSTMFRVVQQENTQHSRTNHLPRWAGGSLLDGLIRPHNDPTAAWFRGKGPRTVPVRTDAQPVAQHARQAKRR